MNIYEILGDYVNAFNNPDRLNSHQLYKYFIQTVMIAIMVII
jgi:hypothetical protein